MNNIALALILLSTTCSTTLASPVPTATSQKADVVSIQPVNHMTTPKISLSITIPGTYTRISVHTGEPIDILSNEKDTSICEFIPQGEMAASRSEIITTQLIVGKSLTAKNMVDGLRKNLSLYCNGEVLSQSVTELKSYQTSELAMVHMYNCKREVVYVRYFSGPYDCTGIQFAKVIKNDENPADVAKELKTSVDRICSVIVG
ncbi:MAG: hypothetical protein KF798_05880 [Candidatus Paracaedibacteraceae bacterium]|nr:hypothetical protein [Candidatus Paracaedibacteraceae bacterium]